VFQNFNLFPHFSVERNITEAQVHVLRRTKADAVTRAKALLEKMGLSDKAGTYPFQLSGGQQQRVSIARALALDPEVLFFDEPTSALDPELTGDILKVIRDLAAEKMTMVIVTHEIPFAREVADRVLFMDNGSFIEEGPASELIDNPRLERTKVFLAKLSRFTAE
jgi:polar amino acid transport system ATP-binding protein